MILYKLEIQIIYERYYSVGKESNNIKTKIRL
jgi:hypothetical protein